MFKRFWLLIPIILCSNSVFTQNVVLHSSIQSSFLFVKQKKPPVGPLERQMLKVGLVNIKEIIPSAILNIRYSDTSNFLHTDVYGVYNACYLTQKASEKLKKAAHFLDSLKPGYKLLIFDCARPISVQQKMWDALKMSNLEKGKYVSNPKNYSVHNYGAAVDLSFADSAGNELDMGTPFDFFGPEAHPGMENYFLEKGILTKTQIENRKLLRKVMYKSGFSNIPHEWWHFNAQSRGTLKACCEPIR